MFFFYSQFFLFSDLFNFQTQLHAHVPVHRGWLKTHDGCIKCRNYRIYAGFGTIVEENDRKKQKNTPLKCDISPASFQTYFWKWSHHQHNTSFTRQWNVSYINARAEGQVRGARQSSHLLLGFLGCKTCLNVFVGGNFIRSASFTHRHHFTRSLRANGPLPVVEPSCNRSTSRQQRCCCHHSMKCSFCPSVILNRWREDAHCFQTSALQKVNEEIRIKGCKTS